MNLVFPLLMIIGAVAGLTLVVMVLGKVIRLVGSVIGRVFQFVGAEITDSLQLAGSLIASAVFIPLSVVNVVLNRWSAARHYGRSLEVEMIGAGKAIYRVAIRNPLRLIGLSPLTDGLERRVPEAVSMAPGRDKPKKNMGEFEGYSIVGALPTGGSGAKLFVAKPDRNRQASFAAAGAGRGNARGDTGRMQERRTHTGQVLDAQE